MKNVSKTQGTENDLQHCFIKNILRREGMGGERTGSERSNVLSVVGNGNGR